MNNIESIKEFDGFLNRYEHDSECCNCKMTFSVYLPPQANNHNVPALYWLSGLTCSDDNARSKAGMQRFASQHGIAVIFPDTSPRGESVPDDQHYDLGQGAGFYVNATESPWNNNFNMYQYVVHELPDLVETNFAVIPGLKSIAGHSMGGHGALICALKNSYYQSVSAFAPILNPVQSEWGKGCFGNYLGASLEAWRTYDATELVLSGSKTQNILIDQGTSDEFYDQGQLLPENFQLACKLQGQEICLRMQEGYDHSYHFIASFIEEHMAYHAKFLKA